MTEASGIGRRAFLGTLALGSAAVAAGGLAVANGAGRSPANADRPPRRGFFGATQVGIAEPAAAFGLMAAFRCVDADARALRSTLRALTAEAQRLVDGIAAPARPGGMPPADTGVLPDTEDPGIRITVSVGASLFDDRYGLSAQTPSELVPMGFLANDRLDPARTHGDVLLTLSADRPDACLHALRQLMRATRSGLVLHWMLDGYNRPDDVHVAGRTDNRNLMGFKDGTSNLDVLDSAQMDTHVWVTADRNGGAEPAWAVGGSYQVVRAIRMFVEQWDRASLNEQESIIGRHKRTGAPLGRADESDVPTFDGNPADTATPIDAHIRLARPRTPDTEGQRMLRKGFSYSRGFDGAGTLDQGLAFVSFQSRLAAFLAVQERLKGERLEEYIQAEGGGFFFVLPGAEAGTFLGQSLLEA